MSYNLDDTLGHAIGPGVCFSGSRELMPSDLVLTSFHMRSLKYTTPAIFFEGTGIL